MRVVLVMGAGALDKAFIKKKLCEQNMLNNVQVEFVDNVPKSLPPIPPQEIVPITYLEPSFTYIPKTHDITGQKWFLKRVQSLNMKLPKGFKNISKFACIRNQLWRK